MRRRYWILALSLACLPLMGFTCSDESGSSASNTPNIAGVYAVDRTKMGDPVIRTWTVTQSNGDISVSSDDGASFEGYLSGVRMLYDFKYTDRETGQNRIERGYMLFNIDNYTFYGESSVLNDAEEVQTSGSFTGTRIST